MATRIIATIQLLLCIICVARAVPLKPPTAGNVTTMTKVAANDPTSTQELTNAPQTPRLIHEDQPTSRAQPVGEGHAITPISTDDLDGRNAYINNQYVADDETLPYNDTASPLYQLLQEQMEHIIASSMPSEYGLVGDKVTNVTTSNDSVGKEMSGYGMPATQANPNNGVFAYGATNFEEDDDIIGPYRKGEAERYYQGIAGTKPSIIELPKPMKQSVVTRPELPSKAAATKLTTTSPNAAPLHSTGGYGAQLSQKPSQPVATTAATTSTQQFKPHIVSGGYEMPMSSYKPQIKEEYFIAPHKYSYVRQNSTVHMHKRRITFKTVASASQIISTPLADLMFKYSIGVAKPSMSAGGSSLYEQQEEPPMRNAISSGYNDELDLPKRGYAGKISHSSHRKN